MAAKELEVVQESTALAISVKGEVVTSNFPEFEKYVVERIGSVNVDLKTPEDVEQGKEDSKELKDFVAELTEKEDQALKEMNQVYMLLQATGRLKDLADDKRKAIDKTVKEISAKIKKDLIDKGIAALELDTPPNRKAVEAATFRKSSSLKMSEAIDEVVSKLNLAVQNNKKAIAECKEKHGGAIGYDEHVLLSMPTEMLTVELERRVERKRQAEEKAKLQAQLDAEKKAAAEKAEKEAAASAELPVASSDSSEKTDESQSTIPRANTKSGNHLDPRPAEPVKGETAEEEMRRFCTIVEDAFSPVKNARNQLKHGGNIAKAGAFAKSLGEAWVTFTKSN